MTLYYIDNEGTYTGVEKEKLSLYEKEKRVKRANIFKECTENELIKSLNKSKICFFCGMEYKEIESLGKLQCRAHYGKLYPKENKTICGKHRLLAMTSCCQTFPLDKTMVAGVDMPPSKNVPLIRGCISMDHNDMPYIYKKKDDVIFSKEQGLFLVNEDKGFSPFVQWRNKALNIFYNKESEECTIRRYDEFSLNLLDKHKDELFKNGITTYHDGKIGGFGSFHMKKPKKCFFIHERAEIKKLKKERKEREKKELEEIINDDFDENILKFTKKLAKNNLRNMKKRKLIADQNGDTQRKIKKGKDKNDVNQEEDDNEWGRVINRTDNESDIDDDEEEESDSGDEEEEGSEFGIYDTSEGKKDNSYL